MAAETVSLAFGIHNHQPVGNFDGVFEEAYLNAYSPFLKMLDEYPDIRISFHLTGILYDWIESHHPEYLDLMDSMVKRDQLEIMTGGFYEPIMPIVPDRDKKAQIEKQTEYIVKRFGVRPTGMWLAERVWEPYLAKPLAEAGVEYVAMDDSHFKAAGLSGEELYGYYRTEEQGEGLAVFPISQTLRYLIPFRPPEETIEYLRQFVTPTGHKLLVFADDGEKFGVWPGTAKWVYGDGWLRRFLELLRQNAEWLKIMPFKDSLCRHASLGPVYIPTASYTEMMEWVLPPDRSKMLHDLVERTESEPYRPFMRGGFWRNYQAKYKESNNIHKKMLRVSEKVSRLKKEYRPKAENHLWAGQCNCGYWHGVFGGLYLNHIRTALYQNLIAAEVEVDRVRNSSRPCAQIEEADFFRDGGRTILVETGLANLYFDLNQGASIFELDHKGKRFNVLNTLTRRPEAYHSKILEAQHTPDTDGKGTKSIHDLVVMKEEGLEQYLHYDWYRRSAFIDHFLGPNVTLDDFRKAKYWEEGDFVNQPYKAQWDKNSKRISVTFSRDGAVRPDGGTFPISVAKTLVIRPNDTVFDIEYLIRNNSGATLDLRFANEYGFSLQAGDTFDRYYTFDGSDDRPRLGVVGERENVRKVSLFEDWVGIEIRLEFELPYKLWHFPIETISSSEAGFERTYQSSVVLPIWSFRLAPGEEWRLSGTLSLIETAR